MEDKQLVTNSKIGSDPKVTLASLIVIFVQSIIIIFGFLFRWDWIIYEFAAMLIIPAVIVLYYGIQATLMANKVMEVEKSLKDGLD